MRRLVLSFFLAVLGHTTFFLFPGFGEKIVAPQLISNDHISVTLEYPVIEPETSPQSLVQPKKQKEQHPVEKQLKQQKKEEGVKSIAPVPAIIQQQAKKKRFDHQAQVKPTKKEETEPKTLKETIKQAKAATESIVEAHSAVQRAKAVVEARPLYQDNPKPKYPALAQRRGWQGTVILAVTVLEDGKTHQVRLHKSSGYKLLDQSAWKAVRNWYFLPGTENGVPVQMEVLIPVHFILTR